jgi:hypothetical protein
VGDQNRYDLASTTASRRFSSESASGSPPICSAVLAFSGCPYFQHRNDGLSAQRLINAICELRPEDSPTQHLRLALLLCLRHEDTCTLAEDAEELERHIMEVTLQLSASTDQHAAIAGDLDSLASTSTCEFNAQHVWTLVRALKVQGQILQLYHE